jgi:predicted small lipoprotein YifL
VKKLLKVVLCLSAMLFSLTSCNGMHNRLYSNDQSIADDTMNDIIKYVNDEDINLYLKCFLKKL